MEYKERRQYIERLLDDLRAQRRVNLDEVLMELIHLVVEIDHELESLRDQVARLGTEPLSSSPTQP